MKYLKTEIRNGIGVVTLDRGTANALNHDMIGEITSLFAEWRNDASVLGAVITGKGNFFSAGLDVIEVFSYDKDQSETFWKGFAGMMYELASWPKPLGSAVNGHSPAGGCIIAITADFRIMAEGNFKIGLNEVPVGIVVPMPVYKLYAQWVGARNAYQFLIQGKLLNPTEAASAGLVDALVPQEQVLPTAEGLIGQMLKLEPGTFAKTKLNLRGEILRSLKDDFDSSFGDTLSHWWNPAARARLEALVSSLKK